MRSKAKWLWGALAAIGVAACSDGDPEPARIRVIHLSPDAPAVSVYTAPGSAPVVSTLEFAKGTAYLEVPAGSYSFAITPAASPNPASPVLDLSGVTLEAGKSYTAVAYDQVAEIQGLALVDDVDGVPAGSIRVRAIHAAAGIGEVDLWNWPNTGAPSPLFTDVSFGEATAAADLPAGAYRVAIDVNGDADPELFFSLPSLAAGTVVNVFAVKDGDDVFLAAQLPDGTVARIDPDAPAKLRVVHLSPTTPAVDVYVNGAATPAIDALAYAEATPYVELDPGVYDFAVKLDGQTSTALAVNDVSLAGGGVYTVVAWGQSTVAALVVDDSAAALSAGDFRVNVVHAAQGVGPVDVLNAPVGQSATSLIADFDEGEQDALDLPAGAYRVGLDLNDDGAPNLAFDLPSLSAGLVVDLFAVLDGASATLVALLPNGTVAQIAPN